MTQLESEIPARAYELRLYLRDPSCVRGSEECRTFCLGLYSGSTSLDVWLPVSLAAAGSAESASLAELFVVSIVGGRRVALASDACTMSL